MQGKISVIIPTFNCAATLLDAIQSVWDQDYIDVEILIIDDGSTDNTKQILAEVLNKSPNIHYFHQSNQGVSSARNLGIQQAQGEFIAFLDADDVLIGKDSLRIRARLLDKYHDAGIIFSDFTIRSDCGIIQQGRLDSKGFQDF